MKAPLFILLLALPALHARTFTSADGRKLEAEFAALHGNTVTLLLPNGKSAKMPLSVLSEEDQKYIREQKPEKSAEVFSDIGMNAIIAEFGKKTSVDTLKMSKDQADDYFEKHALRISRKTTTTNYTLNFTNGLSTPIPGVTVEYTAYRREVVRGKGRQFLSHEPIEIVDLGEVAPKEEKVIESKGYIAHSLSLAYAKTPEKNYKGNTSHLGLLVTVKTNGEIINKFAFPKGFEIKVREYESLKPVQPALPYPTWPPTP